MTSPSVSAGAGASFRTAGDLALLGILVTIGSLPVLTAGAAVATGSTAINFHLTHGRWPSAADLWQIFRARLVPGLIAGPSVLVAAWLIAVDVAALRRGAVPGGGPVLTLVLLAALLAAAWGALVAVRAGGAPVSVRRPAAVLAAAAVLGVAVILAVLIHPVLTPVLAGFVLFALHVVAHRFPLTLQDQGHKLG